MKEFNCEPIYDETDFKILVENESFSVHNAVLVAQSSFFEALLRPGNFWRENVVGELRIEGFSLKTVTSMLE